MGYWGWRPLVWAVVCISVWVSGCRLASEAPLTPTPTATPPITLTVRLRETITPTPLPPRPALAAVPTQPSSAPAALVYTVRPGDTLLGIALDFGLDVEALKAANAGVDPRSLQVGQQLIIPPPTPTPAPLPLPLPLEPPACYDTPTGALLCLGRVANHDEHPVEHVRVQVQLWQADGTPLAAAETGVEQAMIAPGEAAPYGVLLSATDPTHDYATAILLSADPAPQADRRFVPLIIEDAQAEQADGRYAVTATLHNPTANASGPARVVLTLLDSEGRVTGYRALLTPDGIAPGGRVAVRVEAAAQESGVTVSHTLYAEARRASG